MDTVTHGLTGILIAKSTRDVFKKIPPRLAIWFFAFSSIFPDFDIIFRLISGESYLQNHRGITHSLILLPIWSILLSIIFIIFLQSKFLHKKHTEEIPGLTKRTLIELFFISSIGILSHIGEDLITSYGTMIFSPISNAKYSIGSVFIIDLIFSGIILLGIFLPEHSKKYSFKPIISSIFLFILILYVGLTQISKYKSLELAEDSIMLEQERPFIFKAYPQPFSPFKWKIFANDDSGVYYHTNINVLNDNQISIFWESIQKWGDNTEYKPLINSAWEQPEMNLIRNFYELPAFYSIDEKETSVCVYFEDLRFRNPYTTNPFIYGVCTHENGIKKLTKFTK